MFLQADVERVRGVVFEEQDHANQCDEECELGGESSSTPEKAKADEH